MTKGERILAFRKQKKVTQEELAAKLGVAKQTVYKYEHDIITNIPSDKLELMAKVLGTSPEYILGWEYDKVATSKKIDVTTDILTRLETDKNFFETVSALYTMDAHELEAVKNMIDSFKRFSLKEHK